MDRNQLVETFRTMASEIAEREFDHIHEDSAIADLGMDSLSMLELVGSMEREFAIRIEEEKLAGISTVRDLLTIIDELRAAAE